MKLGDGGEYETGRYKTMGNSRVSLLKKEGRSPSPTQMGTPPKTQQHNIQAIPAAAAGGPELMLPQGPFFFFFFFGLRGLSAL